MALLEVKGLTTEFQGRARYDPGRERRELFHRGGADVGLVGESGSGKSMTSLSLLRLVPPPGKVGGGSILFNGVDYCRSANERCATTAAGTSR